jgi:hypothetical protein
LSRSCIHCKLTTGTVHRHQSDLSTSLPTLHTQLLLLVLLLLSHGRSEAHECRMAAAVAARAVPTASPRKGAARGSSDRPKHPRSTRNDRPLPQREITARCSTRQPFMLLLPGSRHRRSLLLVLLLVQLRNAWQLNAVHSCHKARELLQALALGVLGR